MLVPRRYLPNGSSLFSLSGWRSVAVNGEHLTLLPFLVQNLLSCRFRLSHDHLLSPAAKQLLCAPPTRIHVSALSGFAVPVWASLPIRIRVTECHLLAALDFFFFKEVLNVRLGCFLCEFYLLLVARDVMLFQGDIPPVEAQCSFLGNFRHLPF